MLKKVISSVTLLLLLLISWGVLVFVQAFLEKNQNLNAEYIPQEATTVIRVDGRKCLEETTFELLFSSKDEELISMLEERFFRRNEANKQTNYGINFLSDIIIFQFPFENYQLNGVLVNVDNERLFRKNLTNPNSFTAVDHGVGVILSGKSIAKQDQFKIKQLARKLLQKPAKNQTEPGMNSAEIATIQTHEHTLNSKFNALNLLISTHENELAVNGNLNFTGLNKKNNSKLFALKPTNFHVSTALVSAHINDSIRKWLTPFIPQFPALDRFSFNFSGVKIINHSSGFFVIPQMELILTTSKPFSIHEALRSAQMKSSLDYVLTDKYISFQHEKLYYKQLDPNTFYIGINPNPKIQSPEKNQLLLVSGKLTPLVTIQGGWMSSFIEMIPLYAAGKKLANNTDYIHAELLEIKPGKVKMNSKLVFRKNHYPLNEFIRFLLIGEVLN